MRPNQEGMECWVDAAHASEWNNKTASNDPNTARSRMGYVITYAGCPMHWSSKMQNTCINRLFRKNYRLSLQENFCFFEIFYAVKSEYFLK